MNVIRMPRLRVTAVEDDRLKVIQRALTQLKVPEKEQGAFLEQLRKNNDNIKPAEDSLRKSADGAVIVSEEFAAIISSAMDSEDIMDRAQEQIGAAWGIFKGKSSEAADVMDVGSAKIKAVRDKVAEGKKSSVAVYVAGRTGKNKLMAYASKTISKAGFSGSSEDLYAMGDFFQGIAGKGKNARLKAENIRDQDDAVVAKLNQFLDICAVAKAKTSEKHQLQSPEGFEGKKTAAAVVEEAAPTAVLDEGLQQSEREASMVVDEIIQDIDILNAMLNDLNVDVQNWLAELPSTE